MDNFLTQGVAAALILCLVVVESMLLYRRHRCAHGAQFARWLSPMAAGAALVLALLLTQLAAPPALIGLALALAGLAHALGYRQRWM
ncbi:MAG: hypothetical protein AB8B57_13960 [Congregibacter sp.]